MFTKSASGDEKYWGTRFDEDSADAFAGTLSMQSFQLFEGISFKDIVNEASGRSPEIFRSFRFQYVAFGRVLFNFCRRHQPEARMEKLREINAVSA